MPLRIYNDRGNKKKREFPIRIACFMLPRDRLLWVSSSLSASYQANGCFRGLTRRSNNLVVLRGARKITVERTARSHVVPGRPREYSASHYEKTVAH